MQKTPIAKYQQQLRGGRWGEEIRGREKKQREEGKTRVNGLPEAAIDKHSSERRNNEHW